MMEIIHPIDDFLYSLFPDVENGNLDELVKTIKAFYSQTEAAVSVTVSDDYIAVKLSEAPEEREKAETGGYGRRQHHKVF